MKPLDLSLALPRGPRAELDGLIFLPRSIDKVRATLPDGNPGDYRIEGLTTMMLATLGISIDDFVKTVAAAADDATVAAFVREHADPGAYERWNALIVTRLPRGGNRAEAVAIYPWLTDRPALPLVLDVLEEDDCRAFAPPAAT